MKIGAHTVAVVVSGPCGSLTKSTTLTVNQLISATNLSNATVCLGTDANFSTTASGTGPFSYQWTLDGNVTGTNGPSLTVTTASLSIGSQTHTVEVNTPSNIVSNLPLLTDNQLISATNLSNAT